jgi:hypothetical protein
VYTAHTSCAACVLLVACLAYSSILKMEEHVPQTSTDHMTSDPRIYYFRYARQLLLPDLSLGLSNGPEDGCSTRLQNVGKHITLHGVRSQKILLLFARRLLLPHFILGLLIDPQGRGSTFLRNVGRLISNYMTSQPKEQNSTLSVQWAQFIE